MSTPTTSKAKQLRNKLLMVGTALFLVGIPIQAAFGFGFPLVIGFVTVAVTLIISLGLWNGQLLQDGIQAGKRLSEPLPTQQEITAYLTNQLGRTPTLTEVAAQQEILARERNQDYLVAGVAAASAYGTLRAINASHQPRP